MSILVDNSGQPAKSVLFIAPHPDDEAIFTGATIHHLSSKGVTTTVLCCTDGLDPDSTDPSLASTRQRELKESCRVIKATNLIYMGFPDSGLAGTVPESFATRDQEKIAHSLIPVIKALGIDALVYDQDDGIYAHPDHAAAHQLGAQLAAISQKASYLATVDAEHLAFFPPHLVHAAAQAAPSRPPIPQAHQTPRPGSVSAEISHVHIASPKDLAAKRAAFTAHASQISPDIVTSPSFKEIYGVEWFIRQT